MLGVNGQLVEVSWQVERAARVRGPEFRPIIEFERSDPMPHTRSMVGWIVSGGDVHAEVLVLSLCKNETGEHTGFGSDVVVIPRRAITAVRRLVWVGHPAMVQAVLELGNLRGRVMSVWGQPEGATPGPEDRVSVAITGREFNALNYLLEAVRRPRVSQPAVPPPDDEAPRDQEPIG